MDTLASFTDFKRPSKAVLRDLDRAFLPAYVCDANSPLTVADIVTKALKSPATKSVKCYFCNSSGHAPADCRHAKPYIDLGILKINENGYVLTAEGKPLPNSGNGAMNHDYFQQFKKTKDSMEKSKSTNQSASQKSSSVVVKKSSGPKVGLISVDLDSPDDCVEIHMSSLKSGDSPGGHNNFDEKFAEFYQFEVDAIKRNQPENDNQQLGSDKRRKATRSQTTVPESSAADHTGASKPPVVADSSEAENSKEPLTKDEQVQTSNLRSVPSKTNHQPKYQYKAPID